MSFLEKITPAQVIERYLEIRQTKRDLEAEHSKKLAELDATMAAMEGYLLKTMQDRGETQIKTAAGTAFKSPQLRVAMRSREEVIEFVKSTGSFDIFTNHISKDFIKSYMEEHDDAAPPGVETARFTACNVRKA